MIPSVVLDTNVLISATFWDGTPRKLVKMILEGRAQLLTSEAILNELDEKLNGKKLSPRVEAIGRNAHEIVNDFRQSAQLVSPVEVPDDAVRDRKDRIILACAVGGSADYIVSGDKDLTALTIYRTIPILTPANFLARLNLPPTT